MHETEEFEYDRSSATVDPAKHVLTALASEELGMTSPEYDDSVEARRILNSGGYGGELGSRTSTGIDNHTIERAGKLLDAEIQQVEEFEQEYGADLSEEKDDLNRVLDLYSEVVDKPRAALSTSSDRNVGDVGV